MFNVYEIFCKTTWKVYYGSTEYTVERRLIKHERDYRKYLKGKYDYRTSFEIIKNNNYEIRLLETCDDKVHMREREGYYIITFPCVNIYRPGIPGRTMKEYYEDNKETILEQQKKYYDANRETILAKKKETYTCACGSTLTIPHKARHEKTIKHKKYLENV